MNFSEMLFNRDERLLDYITNLQEENERLKNLYTNEKSHKIDFNYIKMLYTNFDKDSVIDDLVYKSEQCRVLYDSAEKTSIENYNLQYRIDKANQFIEKHKRKDGFLNLNEWQTRDLSNILRGDDNEND